MCIRDSSVRWRHTVLETREWSTIIVPNAQLLATSITILGKRDGRTVPQRMVVGFNVDFRFAPSRVVQVVADALLRGAIDNVAAEPPPNVVCTDFPRDAKDGFATYAVRYWIRDLASDEPTSSLVRARIYTALQRIGHDLDDPARREPEVDVEADDHALRHRPTVALAEDGDTGGQQLGVRHDDRRPLAGLEHGVPPAH